MFYPDLDIAGESKELDGKSLRTAICLNVHSGLADSGSLTEVDNDETEPVSIGTTGVLDPEGHWSDCKEHLGPKMCQWRRRPLGNHSRQQEDLLRSG